jgi:hypothetical protein
MRQAAKEANKDSAKDAHDDVKDAATANDRSEHVSFKAAREQSSRLTRGVKLTAAERWRSEDTPKRYDVVYKYLEKQERTDLRGILTPSQQTGSTATRPPSALLASTLATVVAVGAVQGEQSETNRNAGARGVGAVHECAEPELRRGGTHGLTGSGSGKGGRGRKG